MASGLWTGQQYKLAFCHHHQCRLKALITRMDIEAWVAVRTDLVCEHKLTPTPAVSALRSVSKQLPKVQSVWIEEARCRTRHSQKKLRETSDEERKLEVKQESWQSVFVDTGLRVWFVVLCCLSRCQRPVFLMCVAVAIPATVFLLCWCGPCRSCS